MELYWLSGPEQEYGHMNMMHICVILVFGDNNIGFCVIIFSLVQVNHVWSKYFLSRYMIHILALGIQFLTVTYVII